MVRNFARITLLLGCLLLPAGGQGRRDVGRLDVSTAFFQPAFASDPERHLAETRAGPITVETYLRYLAARFGTRYLEDLAFDLLLAEECAARGLARSAPSLARPLGARRFHQSGRRNAQDPRGDMQRKFANEALRQQRIDALVRADRRADETALRALFDRRYGVGGERVVVRHILVSFAATRQRLAASGREPARAQVVAAARARAHTLHRRLRSSDTGFAALLPESDDRQTRRLLRTAPREAGLLPDYNYQRYGDAFAAAVRRLAVGAVSGPVETAQGFHLIEVVDREVTRFEDVAAELREAMNRRRTSPAEALALRRALLARYGFRAK